MIVLTEIAKWDWDEVIERKESKLFMARKIDLDGSILDMTVKELLQQKPEGLRPALEGLLTALNEQAGDELKARLERIAHPKHPPRIKPDDEPI